MTYSAEVLADSPWGFWEFLETSGSLADTSGNARASMSGGGTAPTLNQAGPGTMKAINWTTSAGYVETASTSTASTVTMEIWVYLPAVPAVATTVMFMAVDVNTHDKDLWIGTDGKVYFYFYPGSTVTINSASALSLNTWHHIIASVGPAGTKLRIDKVDVATHAATTSYTGSQRLGMRATYNNPTIAGSEAMNMAGLAFWSGTQLSDARTDAHYDAAIGSAPSLPFLGPRRALPRRQALARSTR